MRTSSLRARLLLTLYITPVIYLYLERFRERSSRRRHAISDMAPRHAAGETIAGGR